MRNEPKSPETATNFERFERRGAIPSNQPESRAKHPNPEQTSSSPRKEFRAEGCNSEQPTRISSSTPYEFREFRAGPEMFAFLLRCLRLRSCLGETRQRVSLSAWLETSSEAAWCESNCILLLITSATLCNTCQPLDSKGINGNMQWVLHGGPRGFNFFPNAKQNDKSKSVVRARTKNKARHRQWHFHPDL